jgi:hypothetical protein
VLERFTHARVAEQTVAVYRAALTPANSPATIAALTGPTAPSSPAGDRAARSE